jgi:hypothetical protein
MKKEKSDQTVVKDALNRLRYAKWAVKELGRFSFDLNKQMKMPLEFSE